MAWSYDPSAYTTATKPSVAAFQSIAVDLHTLGGNKDAARYGLANAAFATLVPQDLPGTAYTVTAGSWTTGTATLTIGAHNIKVNQLIVISSVVPSGYNNGGGEVAVTAVTATQVSYLLAANPGAWTSGGTVTTWGTPVAGMVAVSPGGTLEVYSGSAWGATAGLGDPGSNGVMKRTALNTTAIAVAGTDYNDPTLWPACQVQKSAVQSIPNSAYTSLTFDTNNFDLNGPSHSTSTNPTRFTVPAGQGGRYLVTGALGFVGSATGQRGYQILKNGATVVQYGAFTPGTAGSGGNIFAAAWYGVLAAADYLEIQVFQDSGGSLNTNNLATQVSFARVG